MIDRVTVETRWLRETLDELHRLHIAVSTQKIQLDELHAQKSRARKHQGARSQPRTTRRTTPKATVSK